MATSNQDGRSWWSISKRLLRSTAKVPSRLLRQMLRLVLQAPQPSLEVTEIRLVTSLGLRSHIGQQMLALVTTWMTILLQAQHPQRGSKGDCHFLRTGLASLARVPIVQKILLLTPWTSPTLKKADSSAHKETLQANPGALIL